jgi:hypothetical protein
LSRAARDVEDAVRRLAFIGSAKHLGAPPDRDEPCGPHCEYVVAKGTETTGDTEEIEDAAVAETAQALPPIACSLTTADLRGRVADWRQALAGAERTAVPGGVRLTVPSDRAAALAAPVVAEQRCCPFIGFRLEVAGPVLRLEVSAPSSASDLLEEMFPSSL